MPTTGQAMLVGLSRFVDDYFGSTTSSAGASDGSTLVDIALENFGDNRLVGQYVRITAAGTNQYKVSRITANAQATGTVTMAPPMAVQVATSITYELHKYEPRKKFTSLDSARISAADTVFRLIYDETITTDGYSVEYDIPPTMNRGPGIVYVENLPWSPLITWNFIPSPQCDNGMTGWTAASVTTSTYARIPQDRVIPKYGPNCTKLVVAGSTHGTMTLPVANMINGVTAATSGGRAMTYLHWIYCKVASRVTLKISDDSGTLGTSSFHQGRGWELLRLTAVPSESNATTLSLVIDVASGTSAVTAYANNAWFYYGDEGMVTSNFYSQVGHRIRRDDTKQKILLDDVIPERRQLRLVGKEILTALGSDPTTQATTSMEVDETTAEILYAEAAENLFEQERVSTQNLPQVLERIKMARDRAPEIQMNWGFEMPERRITSPYMR